MSDSIRNLYVCAEFIASLKIANIFVGTSDNNSAANITQVICERQCLRVTLLEGALDETIHLTWLGSSIRLLPNTCSKVEYTPQGLALRCNFEEDVEVDQNCANHSPKQSRVFDRIRCRFCGSDFMETGELKSTITTRVPVSSLGLPQGLDCDHMNMTYFCHAHGHGSADTELANYKDMEQTVLFRPQKSEYFDCDTYFVFHDDVLNRNQMLISETDTTVSCARCHKRIGECCLNGTSIKLYIDAITEGIRCASDRADIDIFTDILSSCAASSQRKLCFVCTETNSRECLHVIIMDKNLKSLRGSMLNMSPATVKSVFKLLYKLNNTIPSSDDATSRVVRIHRNLFNKFGVALTKSTRDLPPTWRYADDFCVGYVSR